MTDQQFTPRNGMDVFGSDGEKVGSIDAVEQDYFVVRKGWFFPEDHYIPFSAVNNWDEEAVYLNVTRDGALEQQWGQQPVVDSVGTTDATFDQTTGDDPLIGTTDTANTLYGETTVDDPTYGETSLDDRKQVGDVSRSDHDTIEVREEDLDARTREVERGAVHVDKHVVEEQQSLEVPVTEEEVHIERRSVDRPADGTDLEDTHIDIPLRGEEVEVSKSARVVEEIDIDKTQREHTETVSDTVRREEVDIHTDELGRDGVRHQDDDRSLMDKARDAIDGDDDTRNR